MNLLDDVLAVMDKHLETSNKHTDRNSLGKLTHFFEGGILKFIKLVFVGTRLKGTRHGFTKVFGPNRLFYSGKIHYGRYSI